MSYALGIELTDESVRVALVAAPVASLAPTPDAPTGPERILEEHPPVLFCDAGQTWAGRDALEQGAGREQGFVNDIVAGFTVDRLFLTAGRLLTPDQALRELLWGIVSRPARKRQEWAGAITVSCPATWNTAAQARTDSIVSGLGLQRPRVVTGYEAAAAAADAFARLPLDGPGEDAAVPLPSLQSDYQRQRPVLRPTPLVVPQRTAVRSPKAAILASLAAVAALVLILGVVLLLNRGRTPAPNPDTQAPASAVVSTR